MAFVDEIEFKLSAGKGGNGVVRWLHLKGAEWSGPAGGNGGQGGDVYVRGVTDMNLLFKYRHDTERHAQDGADGRSKTQHGENGADLILDLPLGSVVTNMETGQSVELLTVGEKIKILAGGKGGWGNAIFKGPTNRAPQDATDGKPGEKGVFKIELRLIADAGLIGLPSAGKSTLLNQLTGSKSKTAAYHFTTLDPHLGKLEEFVLADIPGIIAGAAEGKGLGFKFLRHISRTRVLLHCIASDSDDVVRDYRIVRGELEKYSQDLSHKKEIIVLTKTDEVEDEAELEKKRQQLSVFSEDILMVNILDDEILKQFRDNVVKYLRANQ